MTTIKRLTQPTDEPILLVEAKEHLRVDGPEEDVFIQSLIPAARQRVEDFCGRSFAAASFAVLYDGDLPTGNSTLAVPVPNATISAVTYIDSDGAAQTFTDYTFDALRCTMTPDNEWPAGTNLQLNVTSAEDMPPPVKAAVLLYLSDLFELRQAHVIGASYVENPAAESLMMPYRERMGV